MNYHKIFYRLDCIELAEYHEETHMVNLLIADRMIHFKDIDGIFIKALKKAINNDELFVQCEIPYFQEDVIRCKKTIYDK